MVKTSAEVYAGLQVRDLKNIDGSVKQTLKDLNLETLNLLLLPASGSMDVIRVRSKSHSTRFLVQHCSHLHYFFSSVSASMVNRHIKHPLSCCLRQDTAQLWRCADL